MSLDSSPHLQFESGNIAEIRRWLGTQGVTNEVQFPAALGEASVRGCSVYEWRGHKIPAFCLLDGPRHIHLFAAEELEVVGGPGENQIELGDYGMIRTASWKIRQKTYVLTGLNTRVFVKKFRQDKQWHLPS